MTGSIGWEEVGNVSKNGFSDGQQIDFLRLKGGNEYEIRPLGKPIVFFKYVRQHDDGGWRWAICEDPQECPVRKKHNIEPSERYAVNIIDRSDGKIKVMEGPFTVFKAFRDYQDYTKKSPGGPEGADFKITVKGAGLKTRYTTNLVKHTSFTDEEKSQIKEQHLYKLEAIYKVTPSEEIEYVLFGSTKEESKDVSTVAADAEKSSSDDLPF